MKLLRKDKVIVYRRDGGRIVHGHWTFDEKNTEKFENIKALIVPLNGRELLLVPEGDRTRQHKMIFFPFFEILLHDIVESKGEKYQVQVDAEWEGVKIKYRKVRAVRLDNQDEGLQT